MDFLFTFGCISFLLYLQYVSAHLYSLLNKFVKRIFVVPTFQPSLTTDSMYRQYLQHTRICCREHGRKFDWECNIMHQRTYHPIASSDW